MKTIVSNGSLFRSVAERFEAFNLETPDFLRMFETLYGVLGADAVGAHPRFQPLLAKLEALLAFLADTENPSLGPLAKEMERAHRKAGVSAMMFVMACDRIEETIRSVEGQARLLENIKRLKYAVAQIHDESVRAESARENQDFLESILELSADGVVTSDLQGNILTANKAALGILGYNPTLPQSIFDLIPEKDIEDHKRWVEEIISQGDGTCPGHETEMKSKKGTRLSVLLHHGLARHPGTKEACIVYYFKDITELKDIVQRLKEREELKKTRDALKELAEDQRRTIEALSAPILPVWGRILLMPAIGRFDEARFQELEERLLVEASKEKPRYVLLDLTGLFLDSTALFNRLLRLVSSLKLLGAKTVLVWIKPQLAKGLVGIGADLKSVPTYTTLQQALRAVLGERAWG